MTLVVDQFFPLEVPELHHLIVGASSESDAGNFNNSSDNVFVGHVLLLLYSFIEDLDHVILATSDGDSVWQSQHRHSMLVTF